MLTSDNELAETMQGVWLLHFCSLYMAHNPQKNPSEAIEAATVCFDAVKAHQAAGRKFVEPEPAPPAGPAPQSPGRRPLQPTTPAPAPPPVDAPSSPLAEFTPEELEEMRLKKTQREAASMLRTALASMVASFGSKTEPSQAVVDFQSVIDGLATDGVLGPLTRAAGLALGIEFPAEGGPPAL